MKRKLFSLVLVLAMMFTLVACGGTKKAGSNGGSGSASGDGAAQVTGPITIDFWHTFAAGPQADYVNSAVKRFNESNEYGITVNPTYIGSYVTLRSQLTTSIGAGDNPQVTVLGMSDILASAGVLVDMKAYAERDNFDVDNYLDVVQTSMYYEDQLTALPLLRSCPVLYYNADLFAAAGYTEPPKTIDELVEIGRAVKAKTGAYGFEMELGASFQVESLLRSLGSEGIIDKDKSGASCLDDGTLLKVLKDWKSWCDEGWCLEPTITSSQTNMFQKIYSKELASCFGTSASKTILVDYARELGIDLRTAPFPGYDGPCGVGAGGDISIIEANNDEQQIAASWEFVKFMMSDEEIAKRCEETGYLPVTEGSAELMKDLFDADPYLAVAYEARKVCEDLPGCSQRSEWQIQVDAACSYVIQDKSKTPEEAIDYLKSMLSTVFY